MASIVDSQVRVVSVRVKKPVIRSKAFCNFMLLVIAICCVLVLILCGMLIVKPYRMTHFFEKTTCTTTSVNWQSKYAKCNCYTIGNTETCEVPETGSPGFPCLQIMVMFEDRGRHFSAMLYNDDYTWSMTSNCSYPVCDSYTFFYGKHSSEVDQFMEDHNLGKKYDCLYNPKTDGEVIITKSVTGCQVFHSMFWPSLVFLLSLGGMYYIGHRTEQDKRNANGFTRL